MNVQRVEEIKSLQDDLARLRAIVQQLSHPLSGPRVFIKPPAKDAGSRDQIEERTGPINRWSLYSAYKYILTFIALNFSYFFISQFKFIDFPYPLLEEVNTHISLEGLPILWEVLVTFEK